jgi:hypothetical protein
MGEIQHTCHGGDEMIKAGSVLSVVALLLVGGVAMATPAMADGEGSGGNGGAGSYGQVPPPPPNAPRPPVIGPPGLATDKPWDGVTPLQYPKPRPAAPAPVYNAPAPVYKAPAAPAPAYKAPVYKAPVPVYVPPAAPAIIAPAVPVPEVVGAPAAPESVQDAAIPAATPSVVPAAIRAQVGPVMLRGVQGASSGSLVIPRLLRLFILR